MRRQGAYGEEEDIARLRCLGGENGVLAEAEEVVVDDVALPEPGLVSGNVGDGGICQV